MPKKIALTGNEAVAEALRQIDPDVAPAYPITPQTELMHKFAEFVADGLVKTEMVLVESEHSAMSAAVGAAAAGARACTATSSCGLALMWEILYVAASLRLPILLAVVNRALSGPINIHCDHSDSMGARDAGWIQIFSEDSQEAYHNTIQAIRIAEHPDVLLPVMVTLDGFIISHTTEVLNIIDDDAVKQFIGEYKAEHHLLDPRRPITVGPLDLPDYYFEHKRQQSEAMEKARQVILDVGREFKKISGKEYGFFEEYCMDDAEVAIVALGSATGTTKNVVDGLRARGLKVGLLKLRVFRPFPAQEIAQSLSRMKAIAVLDRSHSFGSPGGPLFTEVRSALYGKDIPVFNYIYGLGGRDLGLKQIESVYSDILNGKRSQLQTVNFLGVRE